MSPHPMINLTSISQTSRTTALSSEVPRFVWGAAPLGPWLPFQNPHTSPLLTIRASREISCRRSRVPRSVPEAKRSGIAGQRVVGRHHHQITILENLKPMPRTFHSSITLGKIFAPPIIQSSGITFLKSENFLPMTR